MQIVLQKLREAKRRAREESELLERWIADVNESCLPLIVEGREDAKALQAVGIANRILILNTGPRYQVIEHIVRHHQCVIILTDFDSEGRRLYGMLKRELAPYGIHVDKRFREELQKTRLDQVEGIVRYCRRICRVPP